MKKINLAILFALATTALFAGNETANTLNEEISIVHDPFPVMTGGGQMSNISTGETEDRGGNEGDGDHQCIDQDVFFFEGQGVRDRINILKFMYFGNRIHHRYTPDSDMINTSSGFINNFTATASLQFGKF